MSPLETPGHVERMAKRLSIAARDIGYLSERLRRAGWVEHELEDLGLARAQLRQAIELLVRHARHWRRGSLE